MRCLRWLSCPRLSAALLGLALALPAQAQSVKLLELIRPQKGEAQLEQVPWLNFLWEARLKAAAEGKPIFIWAAGGPPGGC